MGRFIVAYIVGILLFGGFVQHSAVAATLDGPIQARVSRVIDGDTFVAEAANGISHVRIRGIDAPELHTKRCGGNEKKLAQEAKAQLEQILANGKRVSLTKVTPDKYFGRYEATVSVDGKDLAQQLLADQTHFHAYNGKGKRAPWCDEAAAARKQK
jgi:micrococcal nuclease